MLNLQSSTQILGLNVDIGQQISSICSTSLLSNHHINSMYSELIITIPSPSRKNYRKVVPSNVCRFCHILQSSSLDFILVPTKYNKRIDIRNLRTKGILYIINFLNTIIFPDIGTFYLKRILVYLATSWTICFVI
jgi:hypothetical protein